MFASSLVKNQLVTMVLAGGFISVLELCHWIKDEIEEPALATLVGDLAPYWGHFHDSFGQGLIRLSDVVFMGSVGYLGLFAATQVLKSQRWQ